MALNEEDRVQKGFCEIMDLLGVVYYSIPNAAKRGVVLANIMKMTGMKAGVPDLHMPEPFELDGVQYHSLYVETKTTAKHSKPSKEQLEWHDKLRAMGHRVEIVRDSITFEKLMAECYPSKAIKFFHLKKYIEQRHGTDNLLSNRKV